MGVNQQNHLFFTRSLITVLCLFSGVFVARYSLLYGSKPSSAYATIDSLLTRHDFFAARDYYSANKGLLGKLERLLAGARIDNQFNRLDGSHRQIARLLRQYGSRLGDSITCKLLELEVVNLSRTGRYGKAAKASQTLVSRYAPYLTPSELDDHQTTRIIWQSLSGTPRQKIAPHADVRLPLVKDKVGLLNLWAHQGTDSCLFVFDTGANMSVVNETMADRFGMEYMDSSIYVNAITGIKVKSRIAVCGHFRLGCVDIRHAYFLVFPDTALAFPQIDYQIHGIIGFPVIEGLKEIIVGKDHLTIPARSSASMEPNLALDFLTPVIRINGDSYTFDTGAKTSILYPLYYHKYVKDGDTPYPVKKQKFGGAGGSVEKDVHPVDFEGTVSGRHFLLKEVSAFAEPFGPGESDYFGNVGQDLIQQLGSMTINFEKMFVRFD
ncbi:MAG: retropepsin-like aspartic protease [Breznakibacter sp.]